ncbi:TrmB family transcriptional regulator sugar-binding domain-containing protein [Marinomonas flavescens]|uniref:TrmB family transcriptional regulator sugar-binding domain-containing protein n=1 Tax=Marinomonas flavescens TaxID=2529379 RepID=UPI0010559859|nr:TrmB family transcriptional regulator sugar-binding domain-containing protein [Marinomonas flavescens]
MSTIQVRHESFSIDYQKQNLPELFSQQSSDCDFSSASMFDVVEKDELVSIINKARQTLLIASEQIKEETLIQALKNKADSGVRIYLMVGDKQKNQSAIDTLSGRCLVRTGISQQGALVLVDHMTIASKGLLFMGQKALTTINEEDWTVKLESQQIDDSFRSFCKLFWENTDAEYLQQNQSQQKVNHPDGNVVTNHSYQLCGSLKDCLQGSLNNLVAASRDNFEVENDSYRLLLASDAQNISQMARPGVALTDKHIPSLLMSTDGNWLLPDESDFNSVNWCLKLSDAQSAVVVSAYDTAMMEAAWQYQSELTMGEMSDKQALRFADQPDLVRIVEQSRNLTLNEINTDTIENFLNDSAETLASGKIDWQRDFMGHQIDYQVTIHPPYCSSQAKKDSLYSDWKNSEGDWKNKLSSLAEKQTTIDESQDCVSERFRGFVKSFLLGQGQSSKKLNQELNFLQQWSVTQASPAERDEYKKRLESLQFNIMQRGKDTAMTLDKAEKNYQWAEKKKILIGDLEKSKKSLSDTKVKQNQLLNEKDQREECSDKYFYSVWEETVRSIPNKQIDEANVNNINHDQFLPEILPEKEYELAESIKLAKAECVNKKRELLSKMTIDQAKQWKSTIKEKVWKKHYSSLNKILDNRELAYKKIQRDCDEADKMVFNAQQAADNDQSKLDLHGDQFIYQESISSKTFDEQLGLKAKTSNLTEFIWPNEELPSESTELRSYNGKRYLVIFDLKNLDTYQEDAKSLSAVIVCDKERVGA